MKQPKVQKQPKGVDNDFLSAIAGMNTDQLKSLIVTLQIQYAENEAFKETPEFVLAQEEFDYAKERYQLVAAPVKETATVLKNRTKAVIERLKEKGAINA